MSETVRSYSGGAAPGGLGPPRGARRGSGCLPWAALLLVLAAGAYMIWLARDSHPMERFIPAHPQMEVFANDILKKRHKVADSKLWSILPENSDWNGTPDLLERNLGLPEWFLRNLIGERSHLSSRNSVSIDDAVFVTKMSPVGSILARFYRFSPRVVADSAGGLNLRQFHENGLYYALRGRVLLASASRRALIYALTLDREEHVDRANLASAFAEAGSEDVSGAVLFTNEDSWGETIASLGFALRLDPSEGVARFRIDLQPQWRERLQPLLTNARPVALEEPFDGPLTASMNFSAGFREVWTVLGAAFEWPLLSERQWSEWAEATGESGAPARVLTELLGPAGPSVTLAWQDMNLLEVVPTPRIVATMSADRNRVDALLANLPAPPSGPAYREPMPFHDEESGRLVVPGVSGPDIEPTAGWLGDSLLVTTSRTLADTLLAEGTPRRTLDENGNLYVSVRPASCLDLISDAGDLLAENGLLKDHTPQTFHDQILEWRERVRVVQHAETLISVHDGSLEGHLRILCSTE